MCICFKTQTVVYVFWLSHQVIVINSYLKIKSTTA